MLLIHVTKDDKCAHCNANVKKCPVCQDFFHAKTKRHKICSPRCKMRKLRGEKKPA